MIYINSPLFRHCHSPDQKKRQWRNRLVPVAFAETALPVVQRLIARPVMVVGWSLVFLSHLLVNSASSSDTEDPLTYHIIGVSGGLQDGFPDHFKLDYGATSNFESEPNAVRAIFVGRALVRGCKAYLDVMQEGWRQYTVSAFRVQRDSTKRRSRHSSCSEIRVFALLLHFFILLPK
jgi:hypothetical protein